MQCLLRPGWKLADYSIHLYSSREPSELSQWLGYDDSTISIVVVIIIIIIIIINIIIISLARMAEHSFSKKTDFLRRKNTFFNFVHNVKLPMFPWLSCKLVYCYYFRRSWRRGWQKPELSLVSGHLILLLIHIVQGGPKNTWPFLNIDNFPVDSEPVERRDMSTVCKFCPEKKYKSCIAVCLNILCLICVNVYGTWNYADNNVYFSILINTLN